MRYSSRKSKKAVSSRSQHKTPSPHTNNHLNLSSLSTLSITSPSIPTKHATSSSIAHRQISYRPAQNRREASVSRRSLTVAAVRSSQSFIDLQTPHPSSGVEPFRRTRALPHPMTPHTASPSMVRSMPPSIISSSEQPLACIQQILPTPTTSSRPRGPVKVTPVYPVATMQHTRHATSSHNIIRSSSRKSIGRVPATLGYGPLHSSVNTHTRCFSSKPRSTFVKRSPPPSTEPQTATLTPSPENDQSKAKMDVDKPGMDAASPKHAASMDDHTTRRVSLEHPREAPATTSTSPSSSTTEKPPTTELGRYHRSDTPDNISQEPLQESTKMSLRGLDNSLLNILRRLRRKLGAGRAAAGSMLLMLLYFLIMSFFRKRAREALLEKQVNMDANKASSFALIMSLSPEDIQDVLTQLAPLVVNGMVPLRAVCEGLYNKVEEKRKDRKEEQEILREQFESFYLRAQSESKQQKLDEVRAQIQTLEGRLQGDLADTDSLSEDQLSEKLAVQEEIQKLKTSEMILSKEVTKFAEEAAVKLESAEKRQAALAQKNRSPPPQPTDSTVNTIDIDEVSNYFYPDSDEYKIKPWIFEILFKNAASGLLGGERMVKYDDVVATTAAIVKTQWNPLDRHSRFYFPPSLARSHNIDMPAVFNEYTTSTKTAKSGKSTEELLPVLEDIVKAQGGKWDELADFDKRRLVERFEFLRQRNENNRHRLDNNPDLRLELAWISQLPPSSAKMSATNFHTPLSRGQFDKVIRSMAVSGHFEPDALIKKRNAVWPIQFVSRPINEVSQQFYDYLGKKANDDITLREFVDASTHFGKLRENHFWYYDPDNYTNWAGMTRLRYSLPYKIEKLKQQVGLAPKPMHQVLAEKNTYDLEQKLIQGGGGDAVVGSTKKRSKKNKVNKDKAKSVVPPTPTEALS